MSLDIPTFTTERLRLTAFDEERHFEGVAAFFADPVSATYGGPCDRADAWRKFATYLGHWVIRGYGPWAVETRAAGEFVGIVGPWYPEGWPEPEITWALLPAQHGRGYATEAAGAALSAAYDVFGWTTATSVIASGNTPSIAVAERLGAVRQAEVGYRYGAAYLYRHRPPSPR
ncbi:MAG: GNAT family N-acetyltransferase [Kineosporiaceae bacterium]